MSSAPAPSCSRRPGRSRTLLAALLVLPALFAADASAQDGFLGNWEGSAAVGEETTPIGLRVARADADGGLVAHLDAPELGGRGIPMDRVAFEAGSLRLDFRVDGAPHVIEVVADGTGLRGTWRVGGDRATARLRLEPARTDASEGPRIEDVSFESSGVRLAGSIVLPRGEGHWPAVVHVHGSGNETRDASRQRAARLSARGIASLIYDKRGTGASTGDWTEVGFPELAADALAAVERLAEHPEIDAAAIGLAGTSQGGWVAPLAASRSPRVAFLITFSGPLVTPAEEGHWDSLFPLRDAGYGEDVLADVEEILALWDEALRAGDWDTYREAVELVRQEPWFATARLPGEFSGPRAEWYRGIMDFDPVPLFERLEIPILAFFGLRDESIPAAKSAAILERLRDERGKRITVVCYPEADHALRRVQPRDGGFRWPAHVPRLFERQADWILAVTRGS